VNIIGLAVPSTKLPLTKLPSKLASATLKPIPSSASGELNVFFALLSKAIDKKTAPLPTVQIPVDKGEKRSETAANPIVIFEVPQFTPIAPQSKEPGDEAPHESKTTAKPSLSFQGTSVPRVIGPDVAFGLRLTKNQPAAEDTARVVPDAPAPSDVPKLTKAIPEPTSSAPPNLGLIAVLTADNVPVLQDSKHPIRPEATTVRSTPAQEKAIPPAEPKHSTDGNSSGNAETEHNDSAPPHAPKQNQATVARIDDHLQGVSANQFEIARTTEPQPIHSTTNAHDPTKVSSDPEINPALQPQPARQISLKLTGPDSTKVDLLLTERAGKMQIAVRTGDHALAKSMQTDLTELVGRLEDKGFKTEAWIPTSGRHVEAAVAPQASSENSRQNQQEHSGGASQQQQRQGQNQSNQRQQARWKAQLEETSSTEQKRTQNI
jgi:hypothetical protein